MKDATFVLPSAKRRASLAKAVGRYGQALDEAAEYLAGRGIPIEVAAYWQLGVVTDPLPEHEQYRGMLVIPYLTPAGPVDLKFRCLQAHDCKAVESHAKYMHEAGSTARLFGVTNLSTDSEVLCLCEGELDTLVCASLVGIPAIGISGASKWRPWWNHVFEGYSEVVLIHDGDDAGRKMAQNVGAQLYNSRAVPLPKGEDVNSFVHKFGPDALRERAGLSHG